MSFTVEVAGKSDVGCVRTNNEDNFGYDTRQGIFVVCDGMGGQAAGEVASKIGVDTVLNYFREASQNGSYPAIGAQAENVSDRARALASAIHLANQTIHEAAVDHATRRGMGSTIVTVLIKDDFFSIANVGDSRIYLLRNGVMQQITNDHSFVMEQVRRGMMTREEAEKSANQNIILRALGPEAKVEPELDDMVAQNGDILLLATDGLTKLVKDDSMRDIIMAAPSLDRACDELIETAKKAGGDDNVTCVLVQMVRQPWYKQWFSWLLSGGGNEKWQGSF